MRAIALTAVFGLVACATGTPPGSDDDDDVQVIDAPSNNNDPDGNNDPPIDSPTAPPIDAPMIPIDAPMQQSRTLTQSTSMAITAANTVSCNNTAPGYTTENSYYRVFQLPSLNINTPFTVTRIDFGIEQADAGIGTTQTVQANAYVLNGALNTANLTRIAGNVVTINDQSLGMIQVPMSPTGVVPAGGTLVVELFIPDGTAAGNIIFLGSNASGESGPTYLRAPSCGAPQPATIASLLAGSPPPVPVVHIVMGVTGTY